VRFRNPDWTEIDGLLRSARTIAVVGLSDDASRPSYSVSRAMRAYGYRIVPVNPLLASWDGGDAFGSLDEALEAMGDSARIDIVDVFRRSEHVAAIVDDCIRLRLPALWLQLGVIDDTAALRARAAGMTVVMDRCILVDRRAME
jgi:predicted CoA-binding protein